MDTNTLAAAIAQAVIAALGQAEPTAPAPVQPVQPVLAQRVTLAKRTDPAIPEVLRGITGRRELKTAAATHAVPLWSCDQPADWTLADGTTVTGAMHGKFYAHKAGEPCGGVDGMPRGEVCPGVIRG